MISTNRYALAERSGGERLVKAEEKIEIKIKEMAGELELEEERMKSFERLKMLKQIPEIKEEPKSE